MKIPTKLLKTLIFGMGVFCIVNVAQAGTLENLERERAFLIKTFLDPDLATGARLKKIEMSKPRLIDLERMVLRDDSLTGRNTPVVRKAFSNYDLTFLKNTKRLKHDKILKYEKNKLKIIDQNRLKKIHIKTNKFKDIKKTSDKLNNINYKILKKII